MTESAKRALWRDRIAAFERSGLQRGVWCARHGYKVSSLDYWRQQLVRDVGAPEQRLVPIRVEAVAAPVGALKIEIGGAICLHVGRDVDAAWLAVLLRGLR